MDSIISSRPCTIIIVGRDTNLLLSEVNKAISPYLTSDHDYTFGAKDEFSEENKVSRIPQLIDEEICSIKRTQSQNKPDSYGKYPASRIVLDKCAAEHGVLKSRGIWQFYCANRSIWTYSIHTFDTYPLLRPELRANIDFVMVDWPGGGDARPIWKDFAHGFEKEEFLKYLQAYKRLVIDPVKSRLYIPIQYNDTIVGLSEVTHLIAKKSTQRTQGRAIPYDAEDTARYTE
jgi:hypothetical protein